MEELHCCPYLWCYAPNVYSIKIFFTILGCRFIREKSIEEFS